MKTVENKGAERVNNFEITDKVEFRFYTLNFAFPMKLKNNKSKLTKAHIFLKP